jgi:hypothetical protein
MRNAGVNFTFDKNGYITNYTAEMESFFNRYDPNNEKSQELLDKLKEAISTYEATLQEVNEMEQEYFDKEIEIKDKYYERLQEQLTQKQDLLDTDIELFEYYVSKYEENIYKQEKLAEWYAKIADANSLFAVNDLIKQYNDLNDDFTNRKITEAKYREGMKELQSQFISNAQTLKDNKTQMEDYYSNTLSMAQDETSKYTDKMENLNSVLDHYSSILDLVGKE